MNKRILDQLKNLNCYILASLILISPLSFAKIESPKLPSDQLTQLKERINNIESKLTEALKKESATQNNLKKIEKCISQNEEKLRQVKLELNEKKQKLERLEIEALENQKKHEAEYQALSNQIETRFKYYKSEHLILLINHNDLSKLTRVKHYYQYFNHARKELLQSLLMANKEIIENKKKIDDEHMALFELEKNYEKKATELIEDKQARQALLKKIDNDVTSDKALLKKLKAQQKEVNHLAKTIKSQLSQLNLPDPNQPFAKLLGKLSVPIAENYSFSTLSNHILKSKQHLYLLAKEGTPVQAIYEGRIVFADWLKGVGFLIIIDHGQGYMSLYGNNQILYKKPGDWVNTGEKISLVGQSGGQPNPGLYFEIRKDGEALDPNQWVAKR